MVLKIYLEFYYRLDLILFVESYGFLEDVEESVWEIIKFDFDFDVLYVVPKVNVYKTQHYKKKLEDNPNIELFPAVKNDDV